MYKCIIHKVEGYLFLILLAAHGSTIESGCLTTEALSSTNNDCSTPNVIEQILFMATLTGTLFLIADSRVNLSRTFTL